MATPEKTPSEVQPAIVAGCGGLMGFVAYAIAVLVTMAAVPHRAEGIRQVVDFPWPLYALIRTVLAFVFLVGAGFWLPTRRSRSYFGVSFSVVVAVCSYLAIDLLRRVYIGKF